MQERSVGELGGYCQKRLVDGYVSWVRGTGFWVSSVGRGQR
jgi:hypothetical protein